MLNPASVQIRSVVLRLLVIGKGGHSCEAAGAPRSAEQVRKRESFKMTESVLKCYDARNFIPKLVFSKIQPTWFAKHLCLAPRSNGNPPTEAFPSQA